MKIVAIVVGSLVALFVGSAAVVGVIESVGGGGEGSGSGGKARVGKPDGYVRVTRVIDGDSVVLTRFGETRLIGVNTPEEGRCYETEATRFTRDRLEGQRVGYEFDKDRKDRYGRTLAYLYRDGMHNLALVEKSCRFCPSSPRCSALCWGKASPSVSTEYKSLDHNSVSRPAAVPASAR